MHYTPTAWRWLLPALRPSCAPPSAHAGSSPLAHVGWLPVCAPSALLSRPQPLALAESSASLGSSLLETTSFPIISPFKERSTRPCLETSQPGFHYEYFKYPNSI